MVSNALDSSNIGSYNLSLTSAYSESKLGLGKYFLEFFELYQIVKG